MKRILIVDDSPVVRSVIKIFLEQMSYSFVEATSATQALQLLERERVDLAIVEAALPGASGLALLQRLRSHARTDLRELPVVLLTSDRSRDLVQRGEAAGVSAILRTPVSSAGLLSAVRALAPARAIA
jgi:two-component system chemotaxis response regulator CheY